MYVISYICSLHAWFCARHLGNINLYVCYRYICSLHAWFSRPQLAPYELDSLESPYGKLPESQCEFKGSCQLNASVEKTKFVSQLFWWVPSRAPCFIICKNRHRSYSDDAREARSPCSCASETSAPMNAHRSIVSVLV